MRVFCCIEHWSYSSNYCNVAIIETTDWKDVIKPEIGGLVLYFSSNATPKNKFSLCSTLLIGPICGAINHSVSLIRLFITVLNNTVSTAHGLYGNLIRIWVLFFPLFVVLDPVDLQQILSSKKHTDKIFFYKLLHNFLGNGLITSSGK